MMLTQTTPLYLICKDHDGGILLVIGWDTTDPGMILPVCVALDSPIAGGLVWRPAVHGAFFEVFTDYTTASYKNRTLHS